MPHIKAFTIYHRNFVLKGHTILAQNDKKNSSNTNLNYKASGVDIDEGISLVKKIIPLAEKTNRPGIFSKIGGFGGMFDLKAANFHDPILVSSNDGVGTKLMVAIKMGNHKTIGIDLVAMCANDIVVHGGEPLFFLDYYAVGKLSACESINIIEGIVEGCKLAGCALIGGETAEMPGMYRDGDYDLAGFCVGAIERNKLLTGKNIVSGDIILGLSSSGLHSNGFSLVRKLFESNSLSYFDPAPFEKTLNLGDVLLEPTKLYVKTCLSAVQRGGVKGFAHITGGGIVDNLPRVIPEGKSAIIDLLSWPIPPIFHWLKLIGNISPIEMFRTFNCGIGMVIICDASVADDLIQHLKLAGERAFQIGHIKSVPNSSKLDLKNLESSWHSS